MEKLLHSVHGGYPIAGVADNGAVVPSLPVHQFHVVFAFNAVSTEFEIVGVFSKAEEAKALCVSVSGLAGGIDQMTMVQILDYVGRTRLAALAAILERHLLAVPAPQG